MQEGFGIDRREVMYNDFVLVCPEMTPRKSMRRTTRSPATRSKASNYSSPTMPSHSEHRRAARLPPPADASVSE